MVSHRFTTTVEGKNTEIFPSPFFLQQMTFQLWTALNGLLREVLDRVPFITSWNIHSKSEAIFNVVRCDLCGSFYFLGGVVMRTPQPCVWRGSHVVQIWLYKVMLQLFWKLQNSVQNAQRKIHNSRYWFNHSVATCPSGFIPQARSLLGQFWTIGVKVCCSGNKLSPAI